jgi:two-component system, OmpR family, sensor histidine kinase KdpD
LNAIRPRENANVALEPQSPAPDTLPAYAKTGVRRSWQIKLRTFSKDLVEAGKILIQRIAWADYAQSLGLVTLVTLLGLPFRHRLDHANLVMLYLLVEVIAAVRFGLGPSIAAALCSVLFYHFFFILPRLSFAIEEAQYLLTFAGLLIVGLVISTLTARVRDQARSAQHRESQTAASYDFSRALAEAIGLGAIIQVIITHVNRVFNRDVVVLLPEEGPLKEYAFSAGFSLDAHERAVAVWVFENGVPAGRGTETLSAAGLRYHPLKTARGVVGVLGIIAADATGRLTPWQHRLLEIFASQAAVAIERAQLDGQARQAQLLRETEKLQTALLNSISHDLRTPLASIAGALSSLRDDAAFLDETIQRELVDNAWEEAGRLNRLVANLLSMTRLQAGAMKVTLELCDVQDVVGVVLADLATRLQDRPIAVTIPPDLPLVPMDFVLVSQVLSNLLDNAHKYSASDAPIDIEARLVDTWIEITVADRGLGIPPHEVARVFEKFYRAPRADGVSGTGLGLSICQGIVEVHGGRTWANNRPGGGTVITLALPLQQADKTEIGVDL